jgi:hypothetical protein
MSLVRPNPPGAELKDGDSFPLSPDEVRMIEEHRAKVALEAEPQQQMDRVWFENTVVDLLQKILYALNNRPSND